MLKKKELIEMINKIPIPLELTFIIASFLIDPYEEIKKKISKEILEYKHPKYQLYINRSKIEILRILRPFSSAVINYGNQNFIQKIKDLMKGRKLWGIPNKLHFRLLLIDNGIETTDQTTKAEMVLMLQKL